MSELHLLDILAARHGCFISDLNLSPILRRAALLTCAGWMRTATRCPNGEIRCATLPGMNGILPVYKKSKHLSNRIWRQRDER